MEKIFNKLVRDNIPNIIKSNNEIPTYRVLSNAEYQKELYKKLQEECQELINASTAEDIVEESADVLEVVKAILHLEGKTLVDVEVVAEKKNKKKGSFHEKLFLEKTTSID